MAIDPKTLEALRERRAHARAGGGKEKNEARRAKGLMTARDRIDELFDPGTFQESGLHARHQCKNFGLENKDFPTDGVITGVGYVHGMPVAAFSQDFTVGGGALGAMHSRKICDLMDYAQRTGIPLIGINDSGGARIQEAVDSLSGYGQVFFRNVSLSGQIPQISIIAGPCAGGAAYSPALTDFQIMVRGNANMFICGPGVIQASTGAKTTMDQIGSADVHGSVNGNIHFVANSDAEALGIAKRILDFFPPNNLKDPAHDLDGEIDMGADEELNELVPADSKNPLDMSAVIGRLVDDGDFFEVQAGWARNIITGLARIEGVIVGIIANNPMVKAGTLDIDSSDKGARFIRTCNIYNIPLVTLVDVPGFLPGVNQERGGIIRHGAKMLFAYAASTVPKVTVICRKAYGGAYLAMCSKDMGADLVFAWPTAEIAVMGAEGAVNILYKREIAAAEDPGSTRKEKIEEYREKFASPYEAASRSMVTDVIEPSETRGVVALALRTLLSKRETRPPKKHGNIPL